MGRINGTLSGLTAVTGLVLALFLVCGPLAGQDLGARAKVRSFMMPQYNERDNRLQFIVYGDSADNRGAFLLLSGLLVDFISNRLADVNTVTMLEAAEPYDLNAPSAVIRKYWKDKTHSQGLIFAESATLDKNSMTLRSDAPVKFRSQYLDMDGVGFDAYKDRKLVHVRSGVSVNIRLDFDRDDAELPARRKTTEEFHTEQTEKTN